MGGVKDGCGYESSHVVNVNWNDGKWNVNTWQRDDNEWNDGNRVFSPENEMFLPALLSGSFLLQALAPSAYLPADFLYALR